MVFTFSDRNEHPCARDKTGRLAAGAARGWVATLLALAFLMLAAPACSDSSSNAYIGDLPKVGDTTDVSGTEGRLGDSYPDMLDDLAGVDGYLPDGAPVDKRAPDPDASTDSDGVLPSDSVSDLADSVADTTPSDTVVSDVVYEPYAACSAKNPCKSPEQPLCVLLPNSEEGVCVKECTVGGQDCPPWQECQLANPQDQSLAICLIAAKLNEPCDVHDGIVCGAGLYCLVPSGWAKGLCTTYCTPGQTLCSEGSSCQQLDPANPDPSWGVCLPDPALPVCSSDEQCDEESSCVVLSADLSGCAAKCPQAGQPCGDFGSCVLGKNPATQEQTMVCLNLRVLGETCAPEAGMLCLGEMQCADIGAKDGWRRCIDICDGGSCPFGFVCDTIPDSGGVKGCVPMEFAAPVTPCNANWPCIEEGEVCVPIPGQNSGFCAPSCAEGCVNGTACISGGCVKTMKGGDACLEGSGYFCESGVKCLRDEGSSGAGWCATSCTPGGAPCSGELQCLPAAGGHYCLKGVDFGQPCSLDDGTTCVEGKDLICLQFSTGQDYGYCTLPCTIGGEPCPDVPGAYSECVAKKGATFYCGFLCSVVTPCPEGLTCTSYSICLP